MYSKCSRKPRGTHALFRTEDLGSNRPRRRKQITIGDNRATPLMSRIHIPFSTFEKVLAALVRLLARRAVPVHSIYQGTWLVGFTTSPVWLRYVLSWAYLFWSCSSAISFSTTSPLLHVARFTVGDSRCVFQRLGSLYTPRSLLLAYLVRSFFRIHTLAQRNRRLRRDP